MNGNSIKHQLTFDISFLTFTDISGLEIYSCVHIEISDSIFEGDQHIIFFRQNWNHLQHCDLREKRAHKKLAPRPCIGIIVLVIYTW